MSKSDDVLCHIGLYRVSTKPVLERLFFDGKDGSEALFALEQSGELVRRASLKSGLGVYQLTGASATRLHVPTHRTKVYGEGELREALTVLSFCTKPGTTRKRIERRQLSRLFGRGAGFGRPHAAELLQGADSSIYRLFVPGPNTRHDHLLDAMAREGRAVLTHPVLQAWALSERFSFVALVDSRQRRARLLASLKRRGLPLKATVEEVAI